MLNMPCFYITLYLVVGGRIEHSFLLKWLHCMNVVHFADFLYDLPFFVILQLVTMLKSRPLTGSATVGGLFSVSVHTKQPCNDWVPTESHSSRTEGFVVLADLGRVSPTLMSEQFLFLKNLGS